MANPTLETALNERILILDGAMGTMIQSQKLGEADFRGDRFPDHAQDLKGDNELLTLTRPDVIRSIHGDFLEAGADIIETNTFGANAIAQADYGLEEICFELNREAARLAVEAAAEWTKKTPDRPRFVAGAIGPTPRTLSLSPDVSDPGARNVTWDALYNVYREAALGLMEGGVDVLLIETIFDTLNAKAALVAIDEIFEERGERLPLMISVAITDASGRVLSGQTVDAFWHSIAHANPLSVGINCSLGALTCVLMSPSSLESRRVVSRPTPTPDCPMLSGNTTKSPPRPENFLVNLHAVASSISSAAVVGPHPNIFVPSQNRLESYPPDPDLLKPP